MITFMMRIFILDNLKKIAATAVLLIVCFTAKAAQVDTLQVKSDKMNKDIEVLVIVPNAAVNGVECPVLYLLHRYNGNARTWLRIKP